jgi:hypothetical protein
MWIFLSGKVICAFCRLHALSAGSDNDLPGNPTRIVSGEKDHRGRNIFRLGNPAERCLSVLLLAELAFA